MREYKLYSSGILYGYFYFEESKVLVKTLDVFTNTFGKKEELTSSKNEKYISLFKIDILALAKRINYYEDMFLEDKEIYVNNYDEKYEKADTGYYIQRNIKFPRNILIRNKELVGII